jgi:hypothetical protein
MPSVLASIRAKVGRGQTGEAARALDWQRVAQSATYCA